MPEKAMHIAPTSAASRGRRAIGSRNPSTTGGLVATAASVRRRASFAAACFVLWMLCPGLRIGRLHAHEAKPELGQLLGLGRRWRLEHQVAARLGLRKRHDLANVGLLREERGPAIDAQRDAAMRRRAEVERIE